MTQVNPVNAAVDAIYDKLIRRNYFRGVRFGGPPGDQGWFGPDSSVWYVHEHTPSLMLGLFAAANMELLHPDFAWMGGTHSRAAVKMNGVPTGELDVAGALRRFGHSVSFFQSVAYGPTEQAERVTRTVRGMHHTVKGVRPDGKAYDADDPETLRWAYATVVWGIATAHEHYHPRPLKAMDDYYREFVKVGEALGGTNLPATKAEVADYLKASVPVLGVTLPAVRSFERGDARNHPLPLRPFARQIQWAVFDLQPTWARRLMRLGRRNRLETILRRAAMRAAINSLHLGHGTLPEVRRSRARAAQAMARTESTVV